MYTIKSSCLFWISYFFPWRIWFSSFFFFFIALKTDWMHALTVSEWRYTFFSCLPPTYHHTWITFFSPLQTQGFRVTAPVVLELCRPEWPWTQRFQCLCFLSAGLKVWATTARLTQDYINSTNTQDCCIYKSVFTYCFCLVNWICLNMLSLLKSHYLVPKNHRWK